MSDLIDRKSALDAFEGRVALHEEDREPVKQLLQSIYDKIQALPSSDTWIPAAEHDPDDSSIKIVSVVDHGEFPPYEFVCLGMRAKWYGGWTLWRAGWKNTRNTDMEVVAWMDLPEPYVKKAEEDDG